VQRNDRMALPGLAGLALAVVLGVYALSAAERDQALLADESHDVSVQYADDDGAAAEPRPRRYGPKPGAALSSTASGGPSVAVVSEQCRGGALVVGVRARDSYATRRGVASVTVERQDADGSWSGTSAHWLGDETGSGDRWTAELAGTEPGAGNSLRIVATDDGGHDSTAFATVTAAC